MADIEINVGIGEPFLGCIGEGWIRRVVTETLVMEGAGSPVELGVVVADDKTVRQLNREYRDEDEPTDVLAFALREDGEGTFVNPPDGMLHLGEVVISYPRAVAQAREHGHPLRRELALLLVHGVLHLLGYEHDTPEGERAMRSAEERVLGVLTP